MDTTEPTLDNVTRNEFEVTFSPTIGKLFGALAKAQLSFGAVVKQTDNAAFMRAGKASKYADLAEYIDATQKPLAENGLVVTQWPDVSPEAKSMTLVTILGHESGEWMRGKLTLPAIGRDGFTPQTCGSSITYARRYSYAAVTGCASEDDDGNSASGRGTAAAAQDVAKAKIEAHNAKKAKEAAKSPAGAPECLTYSEPEQHNGHRAYLTNLKEYGESLNEVAAEGLRQIIKLYIKSDKDGLFYVTGERLPELVSELKEVGVELRKS